MSLVLSGYYNWEEGTILTQDGYGYFWATSSTTSSASSRFLFVGGNYLNPQNAAHKELGFTLRCKNSGLFPAGSSAARSYPVSLVLSGFYDWRATAGDKYYQNELGVWWSSNGSDPDNALDLNMSTSHLDIQASNVRQYGFPLRCVKLFIH